MGSLPDFIQWALAVTTIITPFAVFWLGVSATSRRNSLTRIEDQMKDLKTQMEKGQAECREDIQAILRQMSEYPRRTEVQQEIRDIRQEVRNGRAQTRVP